ncbi:hypothetical protein DCC84_24775 [Pseudomonas sp. SXM-1]|nr:hypothetical protein DCC84_24775 [Pseudomonas sp. SXM-1]
MRDAIAGTLRGIFVVWADAFASKPAPTFDRVSTGYTRSNVGAGLLAKRPGGTLQNQESRRKSGGIGRSLSGSGRLPLPARYWRI